MKHLPVFPKQKIGVWTPETLRIALQSGKVKRVISYALGPTGTNIEQASMEWHALMGITDKAEIVLCNLPETAVERALAMKEEGVLAVFWTCAVFKRMHEIFFTNPETLSLFISHGMLLDEMQLASVTSGACDGEKLNGVTVASHCSPAPLVHSLKQKGAVVVDASSNAEAARMCREGEVTACITTESARKIYDLQTLHVFGSPPMVFFGGITAHGLRLLESVG